MKPFVNIDAGELSDEPEELYGLAHVVHVACGGHAGDDASMRRVVLACAQAGSRVGAHPSYPDRAGFGRLPMVMPEGTLQAAVAEQCHALAAVARDAGDVPITSVKLHGALYHAAHADRAVARAALVGAVEALGWEVLVLGPPAGALAEVARELGLGFAREGFADRGVRADGSLVPRGEPGALVTDPAVAAARALVLVASVDTICVHGDTPNAVAIARAVRAVIP